MTDPTSYPTLEEWIDREAIPLPLESADGFNAAVDSIVNRLGDSVEILGLGEPTHGVEDFLVLRNRVFRRLVASHGYTAIAVESSFPRARAMNEFVAGGGSAAYESLQEIGFSHGFGKSAANRELLEWMRRYNADASHAEKIRFYGFDSPTEMYGADSPRQLLTFALDYLAAMDPVAGESRRQHIDALLGDDADWSNPAATFDPTKSIGQSPAANALRVETEELLAELKLRRPEFIAAGGTGRYRDAVHDAEHARQMLNYHASLARSSPNRIAELLGLRDAMMADNLEHILGRERLLAHAPGTPAEGGDEGFAVALRAVDEGAEPSPSPLPFGSEPQGRRPEYRERTESEPAAARGAARNRKVFAFAHNSHLQRGPAAWQMGPQSLTWSPAGAHLHGMIGRKYAVIGVGVSASATAGIDPPEPGTLEQLLTRAGDTARFVPTHAGRCLPPATVAAIPTRSTKKPGYFPFTAQSLADFDGLVVLKSIG